MLHLAFEQEEDAGGVVAVEIEAAGEAPGDSHVDDRQFADDPMQSVGDLDVIYNVSWVIHNVNHFR